MWFSFCLVEWNMVDLELYKVNLFVVGFLFMDDWFWCIVDLEFLGLDIVNGFWIILFSILYIFFVFILSFDCGFVINFCIYDE